MKKQSKTVTFDSSVLDPDIKRPCECQVCYNCRNSLIKNKKQYCEIMGKYKCVICNEYRCLNCLSINDLNSCNNCLRK